MARASEVSESSSECSAEVGEAATGTRHAVCALESPVLSRLFRVLTSSLGNIF